MTDAFTVDEFLAEHRPARATARICTRQDLVNEHARLERELAAATVGMDDSIDAPPVAQSILDLEAEMAAHQREFVFEAIGKTAWTQLIAEYPPTEEQRELGVDHNPETFPAAAIAASAVQPRMTLDDSRRIEAKLNLGQWQKLWAACLQANLGGDDVPKSGLATALARLNARFSTTAALEGSLEASS